MRPTGGEGGGGWYYLAPRPRRAPEGPRRGSGDLFPCGARWRLCGLSTCRNEKNLQRVCLTRPGRFSPRLDPKPGGVRSPRQTRKRNSTSYIRTYGESTHVANNWGQSSKEGAAESHVFPSSETCAVCSKSFPGITHRGFATVSIFLRINGTPRRGFSYSVLHSPWIKGRLLSDASPWTMDLALPA